MSKSPLQNGATVDLNIRASLAGAPGQDQRPDISAYIFSQGGALLGSKALDSQGNGVVSVAAPNEASEVRVLVGPRLEGSAVTMQELLRRGAKEIHLRVDPKTKIGPVEILIPSDRWPCWSLGRCVVRGTLLKRVGSGGYTLDYPVCDATVEVYEVDPLWLILPKLPEYVIAALRDIILHPRPLPDPPPEILEGPFPGPFPSPQPGPDPAPFMLDSPTGMTTQAIGSSHSEAAFALAGIPAAGDLQFAARVGSRLAFEQALLDAEKYIRPIFCVLFPRLVTMQRVATAYTDRCGHFETYFFNGCNNPDTPDLYFRATQRFFIFDLPIYSPTPIPCYTYWNYRCGSEVTLFTYHPLARTCSPCPPVIADPNWVLFTAIGGTSMARIFGSSQALQGTTTPDNRGLIDDGRPFGGLLRPRLDFDNSLRDSLGVKYYKLWWRKGAGGWNEILGDVFRHYAHVVSGHPVIEPYKLGPNTVTGAAANNLYEIPPSVPPIGQWSVPNPILDTENGEFNTTFASPGIVYNPDGSEVGIDHSGQFDIMLELFDTAGQPVNIVAKGIKYFVPTSTDLTGTIDTVDASTLSPSLVAGNQMIVTVHVDNNPTYAEIDAPSIGASVADPCCGVLKFSPNDSVVLPWRAMQKNGFATWDIKVKRVDAVVFSDTGPVGSGSHSTTQTVNVLLTTNLPPTCQPCPVAGFATDLNVYAQATDGWSTLTGYNSSDFEAFVLSST